MSTTSHRRDVFVSHSTVDQAWAQAVVELFETNGISCWIAPRDIVAGETWAGAIVDAIADCRMMLLIVSRNSDASTQVTREIAQAADKRVHILPLRIDDVQPSSEKSYYLSAAHWLTLLGGPTEANRAALLASASALLAIPVTPVAHPRSAPVHAPHPRTKRMALVGLALVGLASAAVVAWRLSHKSSAQVKPQPPDPGPDQLKKLPVGPVPKPVAFDERVDKHVHEQTDEQVNERENWREAPASMRERFEDAGGKWVKVSDALLPARVRHLATGIEFVLVPGGEFTLGTEPGKTASDTDERPVRRVRVSTFYIALHETSAAQYRGEANAGDAPAVDVSYHDAARWCELHDLELPTESEWEYAASGPDDRTYPWGNDWDALRCNAVGANDGNTGLAPVGSFHTGASWCGAQDMAGNAIEFCRGFYCARYSDLSSGADPAAPARGTFRVARGGSCHDPQGKLRTSDRRELTLDTKDGWTGFRCMFRP